MKKRLSAGLLCLCLILALLPVTVFADDTDLNWTEFVTAMPDTGYLEDEAGNVSISNAQGLAWLASLVNGLNGQTADNFSGRTITLTEEIDLDGHDWIPIGGETTAFSGGFDGNGKSITNMNVDLTSYESTGNIYAGLFGVTVNANLHNIIVDGTVTISGDAEKNYAGGIVAYLSGGSLTAGNSSADVTIAAGSNKENYAGGIAGYSKGGTIDGTMKFGMLEIHTLMVGDSTVTGSGTGSFDDVYYPDITNNFAGGITGYNDSGLVKNSSAYDLISASGKYSWNFAGGIVGKNNAGRIEACTTAIGSVRSGGNSGMNYAGGMSGVNTGNLLDCSNFSSVEASGDNLSLNYAGGIAGVNYGEITRSFNGNTVSAIGDDAYNAAGGVAGRNYEAATLANCFNLDSVEAAGDMTGAYPEEEFINDAGGLVGNNLGLVINSYNQGEVKAAGDSSENDAGGLAGYNVDGAIVANSYNTAAVEATGNTHNQAGGLVGANENAHLANSYNAGKVSAGGGENFVGGVAGKNERGIVANAYWLETTAAEGFGQGSGTSCASFSEAQGKSLETAPSFKYTIGTGNERTGTLVMALNVWVKKPSLAVSPYSYQTWTLAEDDNMGYPVFGTPGPGQTIPVPKDPDLPQTGESTNSPLAPILLILAGLASLGLILYRKKARP